MYRYQWWSFFLGAGVATVVILAIHGERAAFWLLAAILLVESVLANQYHQELKGKEREDARMYALSMGMLGVLILMFTLVTGLVR